MLRQLASVLAPPLCWSCSAPAAPGTALCRACFGGLRRLPAELTPVACVPTFSAVAYEGPARDLVRALKFRAALDVAGSMAAVIVAGSPEGLFERAALVPVPLAPERARRRGFNQAEVLARALERRTGLQVLDSLERRDSGTQVGRDRAERARALTGTIRAKAAAPRLTKALLVDDVATTGATLAAAAAALSGAGCGAVEAVTHARTMGR